MSWTCVAVFWWLLIEVARQNCTGLYSAQIQTNSKKLCGASRCKKTNKTVLLSKTYWPTCIYFIEMSFFFVLLVKFAYSFVLFALCTVCCSYTFTTQCLWISLVSIALSHPHISICLCALLLSVVSHPFSLRLPSGGGFVFIQSSCAPGICCVKVLWTWGLWLSFPHVHSLCNPFDSVILTLNFLCSHLLYHLISALLFLVLLCPGSIPLNVTPVSLIFFSLLHNTKYKKHSSNTDCRVKGLQSLNVCFCVCRCQRQSIFSYLLLIHVVNKSGNSTCQIWGSITCHYSECNISK